MNEQTIIDAIEKQLCGTGHKYWIRNAYVFGHDWESDFLNITKTGYANEFEVKISRSDFFCDFKKRRHQVLGTGLYTGYDGKLKTQKFKPNRLWYVVPENLVSKTEIPKHAGLIYMNEAGYLKTIVTAPLLHKEKLQFDAIMVVKFFHHLIKARSEVRALRKQVYSVK